MNYCQRDETICLFLSINTASSRMLEALKSLYMTWDSASCRKERPLAAPIATLILNTQESGCGPPEKGKVIGSMTHQSSLKARPSKYYNIQISKFNPFKGLISNS